MAGFSPDEETVASDNEVKELEKGIGGKTAEELAADELKDGEEKEEGGAVEEDARVHEDDDEEPTKDQEGLTPEQKKERNRIWRENRKARAKEREEEGQRKLRMLEAQNAELHGRLANLEQRGTGMEVATLDQELKGAATAYTHYKAQIAVQMAANNAEGVAEAIERMNLANQRFLQLKAAKEGFQKQQRQPPALDPRLADHFNRWHESNRWYDSTGSDPDSQRAMLEDKILVREGWRPETPEFWTELNKRLAKVLPHRVKGGIVPANRSNARPPVAGSNASGSQDNRRKGNYTLSEERVKAIKEAGAWDDEKARTRMINEYKKYDAKNAQE